MYPRHAAFRETPREKLHHELGFESLVSRRWYHKLCCFYKVFKTQSPRYLFEVIPTAKEPILQEIMTRCLFSK